MLINNGQFIQLTDDCIYDTLNGRPLYIDSKKICVVCQRFDADGNKKGSFVYLDGCLDNGEGLVVKESPEDIIGLVNDGCFCAFSNKFSYDQIPYPEK